MGIKEKIRLKMAMKLAKGMKKEDFLIPLREEIKKQGLVGKVGIDASMKRIEESGMKSVFDQLGITREDIEEAFKE